MAIMISLAVKKTGRGCKKALQPKSSKAMKMKFEANIYGE